MTSLITELDNNTALKYGENGHLQYGWSNNVQELILQFSFQLNRTDNNTLLLLSEQLRNILSTIKSNFAYDSFNEKQLAKGHLSMLYKMIGHTRDIIEGKGEYNLTYMMIYTWYDFFPELSKFAIKCMVQHESTTIHPYGSWKDIKYFCEYCKSQTHNKQHPLIKYAIEIANEQLKEDNDAYIYGSKDISLVAKWIPREKTSFGWLYKYFAINYFPEYIETASDSVQLERAILKCKTAYRKILSTLNTAIDTLQIKQCGHEWSNINFNQVTSISLSKQKKAFLNIKPNGEIRRPTDNDRINCATNFKAHIQKAVDGEIEIKGKRLGMADFTKQAIHLLHQHIECNSEKNLLNSQWRDNSTQNKQLGKMIAMVDVSGSMNGDPMNAAIALGIRIAEKSLLGKRVMTFSSNPTWVNLEDTPDFISQVQILMKSEWGMNTNFYAAFDLILNAIIQNKMAPEDVQDMVLVILSDMQIDCGDKCNKQTLYDTMKTKYEAAGLRVHGVPYKPPHILFWNLRSTSGFPSLSNQPNASMMSGFSPILLNMFCEEGVDALEACSPWTTLQRCLENDRYKIMGDKFELLVIN
jgi:Mg-chelatase subunit ChlD